MSAAAATPAIETRALCRRFGALTVADAIDFRLEAGARHALIGPNGAGKTTFVNMLTGALPPSSGRILLGGEDVTAAPVAARVAKGLGRTFQITSLFRTLPVLDNVALAVAERDGLSLRAFRPASRHAAVRDEAAQLLDRLGLGPDALRRVADLPYGGQRLVEIAVALALRPRVLLLDEPAAGVPSMETHRILDVLAELPDAIAVLIIEHDMDLVFRFAKGITVLVAGKVLVEGTPDRIASDRRVRDVYLGESA